jgi:hypothetical protein
VGDHVGIPSVLVFYALHLRWLSSLSFDAFLVCRSHSVPIPCSCPAATPVATGSYKKEHWMCLASALPSNFPKPTFRHAHSQSSNGCSSQDAPAKVSSLPLEAPFGSRYCIILAPNRLHFSKMNVSRVAGSGCALGTSNRSAVSRKDAECRVSQRSLLRRVAWPHMPADPDTSCCRPCPCTLCTS